MLHFSKVPSTNLRNNVLPLVLDTSDELLVWVAFQFVELNAVQLLKPLVTELTGVVVLGFWSVFLHVPVEGGTLATLVATDLTPGGQPWPGETEATIE